MNSSCITVEHFEPYSDNGQRIRKKGGKKYYAVYVGGTIVAGPMRRVEALMAAKEIMAAHRIPESE